MKDSDTPYIVVGLIIGVAALFLIFRRNNDMQTQMKQSRIGINNWKTLDNVPKFEDVYSKMIQPVAISQPVEQDLQVVEQGSQKVDHIEQIDNNSTQYKNKEVWKIERDNNGDIAEISVSRDARVT